MAKTYYWLKLQKDFFKSRAMKKLRKIAGGDTYTIIYLKLQLLSLKDEGHLFSEYIEEDLIDELALEIDEGVENVRATLLFLSSCGLAEVSHDEIILPQVKDSTGSESESASRVRKFRENKRKALQCNGEVTNSNTEKEKDLDTEIKKEKITVPVDLSPVLDSKLKEFIKYRKVIKKPLKTNRSIESMVKKIGVDFVNEDHLIKCIDYTMDNEYQGVKSEYVKYDRPVFKKSVVSKPSKHIVTLEEAKSNPEFNKMDGVDFMDIVNKKRVNNGK